MMTISLSEVSKRFNRDWIFRKFSYTFTSEHSYAITGPNGSGKSTLLQVIGGAIAMSEGDIKYEIRSAKDAGYRILDTGDRIQNPESSIQNPVSSIQYPKSSIQNIPVDHAFRY